MNTYDKRTAKQLKPYVGSMGQLAAARSSVLDDGKGRGLRVVDVDNGSGLCFTVQADRGMDIGRASFKGIPFAYMSPVGYSHPAYFESDGFRWLRNFTAGLLTGCGMRNAGIPQQSAEEGPAGALGLHGRLSNTPAENVTVSEDWADGAYRLRVSGTVRETAFFAENLELRRTISTALGSSEIRIVDTVTNRGVRPSPLMLLYHINLGFPVLDEQAVLKGNVQKTEPRNEDAQKGLDQWAKFQPPTAGYVEQCFFHDIAPDADGMSRMTLESPSTGLAVEVGYAKEQLPFFTQWKMMGEQEYVLGLEPGNCYPDGQQDAKKLGRLKTIEPDETIENTVTITVRPL